MRSGLLVVLAIASGCGGRSTPTPPAPTAPAPTAPVPAAPDVRPGPVADDASPRPSVVTGDVVDATGAPLDGAEVALVDEAAWHIVAHATTAGGGRFRLEAASAGTGPWTVSAHHPAGVGAFVEGLTLAADSDPVHVVLGGDGGVTVVGRLRVDGTIPPASYVEASAISEHSGDLFALPVAADGTFGAVLPRRDRYYAGINGTLSGAVGADRAGDSVTIVLRAGIKGPPPDDVVRWLATSAAPLTTAEPGHGFDDLAPVARMVGGARIVALGEATHGTREFFQIKHRLVEYLVATQGFTLFAIEANQPECRALNDYVLHGTGDAQAALAGIYFWIWNTEEVLAMIEWMRAWNADPTHARKVHFVGVDAQFSAVAARAVAAYVRRVAPRKAEAILTGLELFEPKDRVSAEHKPRAHAALARAVAAFDAHRKAWTRAGKDAYEVARQDLRVIEQMVAAEAPFPAGSNARDRAMADNLDWALARAPKGTRAIVWAHNGHVASGLAIGHTMGGHLRARWKQDYVSFGFVFDHGAFQAMSDRDGVSDGVGEHSIAPASEDVVSRAFVAAGHPLAIVDLRAAPAGPVRDWFATQHPERSTGSDFVSAEAMTYPSSLSADYDTVIFVEKTTPSRPLPAGRRPSQVPKATE